jgi:hypothetical protein
VAVDLHSLGVVLRAAGRAEEARTVLGDALTLRRRVLGDAHPQTAETVRELETPGELTRLARRRYHAAPQGH